MESKGVTRSKKTLGEAISKAALKKISAKSSAQFVAELREQGITSLEELGSAVISAAKSGLSSSVAFDPEDYPICYKFTTYRPRFDQDILNEIVGQIDAKLMH